MPQGTNFKYICPVCNTESQLPTVEINCWICNCGNTLCVNDFNVIEKIPVNKILQSEDIIQPDTKGIWAEKSFTITGRFRLWFNESTINYWTVLFEDNSIAYLEEGYGHYSLLFEDKSISTQNINRIEELSIGQNLQLLSNHKHQITNSVKSWKIEVEGCTKLAAWDVFNVVDLQAKDNDKIIIIKFNRLKTVAFKTYSIPFYNLQLVNLRTNNSFSGITIKCQKCNENNTIKTYPYALSFACTKCGVYYQHIPNLNFNCTQEKKEDSSFYFALGNKGVIDNIEWEIIGLAEKCEMNSNEKYLWREYTLYNRIHGFSFLSEYDGHWIFLKEEIDTPVHYKNNIRLFTYKDISYSLFNKYCSKVISAKGEFPYNIFNNNQTEVKEYIAPPYIWVCEKNNVEGIKWFKGRYADNKEISAGFKLTQPLPKKNGIGAIQPIKYAQTEKVFPIAIISIIFLLLTHFVFSKSLTNRTIFDGDIFIHDSTNTALVVTPTFELEKGQSNMLISIESIVDNSWIEVNSNLVNTKTGNEQSIVQGLEYYSGFSEGEYWTEGSTSDEGYITEIEKGIYQLHFNVTRDPFNIKVKNVHIKATYDVESTRNLIIPVIIIIITAFSLFIIGVNKERERWRYSNFSPYTYSNE